MELHAKKHNKSWRQAEALVRRHLLAFLFFASACFRPQ